MLSFVWIGFNLTFLSGSGQP